MHQQLAFPNHKSSFDSSSFKAFKPIPRRPSNLGVLCNQSPEGPYCYGKLENLPSEVSPRPFNLPQTPISCTSILGSPVLPAPSRRVKIAAINRNSPVNDSEPEFAMPLLPKKARKPRGHKEPKKDVCSSIKASLARI
jgi:hypothetical protein